MQVLSVDFGTSSVKIGIYREDLSEVCTEKVSYTYDVDGLYAQIDPEIMYAAFIKGLQNMGEERIRKVDILAFDVQSPCMIAMDAQGNAVHPAILHLDRRSYAQSRYALKQLPKERFLAVNGNLPFAGGISSTSMLWLKQERPELYKKVSILGHLNTFLHKKLIGKFLIDPSNASFTGLYETITCTGWSEEITDALGIDRALLPDIQKSLSIAGYLTDQAARETGLKSGLPVLMGANDSTSAAFGAGAVNTGDITNMSGSSEIVTIVTDKPIPHPKYYLRAAVEEGKWICLAITVGGFALDWFRRQFCQDMDANTFFTDYLKRVINEPNTTKVRFLPHLAGDRHSLTKKKGGFSGLTMDTTREDMLRALLAGTFDPILETFKIIQQTIPLNPGIFWTGGMISEEYQRFKEQIFSGFHFIPRANCSCLGMVKGSVVTLGQDKQ